MLKTSIIFRVGVPYYSEVEIDPLILVFKLEVNLQAHPSASLRT